MVPHSAPNPDDPQLLKSILQDLENSYAQLLALVGQSLQIAPDDDQERLQTFHPQIQQLMEETDVRFVLLQEKIHPWKERRNAYPPELAQEVDAFLGLLEKGLSHLKAQLDIRVDDLQKRRDDLKKTLDELNRKRQGVKGYKQKDSQSKLMDKKI